MSGCRWHLANHMGNFLLGEDGLGRMRRIPYGDILWQQQDLGFNHDRPVGKVKDFNQNQPLCAAGPVYPALCIGDRSCFQFFPVCRLIRFSAGNSRKTAIINFFRIFVLNSRVGNTSVSGN